MCGIAGWVAPNRQAQPEKIMDKMLDCIAHRGPDDRGVWADSGVHLGHTRLSIIGLGPDGRQPMQRGNWVVTLNGELYNYRYLKQSLQKQRRHFNTKTDTEVLAVALDTWGVDKTLTQVDGMFAFAAWHIPSRRLVLVRDRMGEKPLFYSMISGGGLVFGSELTALVEYPGVSTEIDPLAVRRFFVFDYVPSPRTILSSVRALKPGHRLEFRDGRLEQNAPYWEIPAPTERIVRADVAKSTLWEAIRTGVRSRLVSDVPVGITLSGGLDSSAVAAAACELKGSDKVSTFTLAFDDPETDESEAAKTVAEHLGTTHYVEKLDSDTMRGELLELLNQMSEPIADTSLVPTSLLARMAKRHVGVVLSGDGGDELFLGYPTFFAHRLGKVAQQFPRRLRQRLIRPLVRQLPTSERSWSLDYKLNRFVDGLDYGPYERHFVWIGGTRPDVLDDLLEPAVANASREEGVFDGVQQVLAAYPSSEPLDRLSHLYARVYLADGVLQKVDRGTMRYGLESRAPMLSEAVVTTAMRIAPQLKLNGRVGKYILRETLKGKLPKSIIERGKQGFSVPLTRWFKGPLSGLLDDVLHPVRVRRQGVVKPEVVERLIREHRAGFRDHRKSLYALLALQLWLERMR